MSDAMVETVPTCEFVPESDTAPCGRPATARWTEFGGDGGWFTCAEHGELAEGHYDRSPFPPWPAHLDGCDEGDEDRPASCALDCPRLALAAAQARRWFSGDRTLDAEPCVCGTDFTCMADQHAIR